MPPPKYIRHSLDPIEVTRNPQKITILIPIREKLRKGDVIECSFDVNVDIEPQPINSGLDWEEILRLRKIAEDGLAVLRSSPVITEAMQAVLRKYTKKD